MNTSQTFKVKFHAEAAARIAELAKEVLSSVRSFGPIEPPPSAGAEIHPVAHIGPDEIIGEIKVRQSSFNGLGTEVGRYWISKGMRVGWEGREFEAIKDLAIRLGSLTSIKGRVSESFLLDEVFASPRFNSMVSLNHVGRLHNGTVFDRNQRLRNLGPCLQNVFHDSFQDW